MKRDPNKIECPKCGTKIDVSSILYQQVDEELKKKYEEQLAKDRAGFEKQKAALDKRATQLEEDKKGLKKQVASAVEEQLKKARKEQEKALKAEIKEEQAEVLKEMKDELAEKSKEVKEFNKTKLALERLQREKDEMTEKLAVEAEKKLNDTLKKESTKIRKAAEEEQQLKLAERDKVIDQLNQQLKEAQKKAEQGSMQLQGEVQELAIEDWLREQFPLDTVDEVKKGARGADCLQTVNTETRQGCGTIYYESKRTKAFQPSWIEKFKGDMRAKGADVGVLVTEAMPGGMERMGLVEGVWVCSFPEFKGLCAVLRQSVIRYSTVAAAQENKGDKMVMLYDFLTGNEFRGMVEAIVEGFTQMQTDLESEKRAMTSIWKKREKQIQKVLTNTSHMHSSIRGIAGNSVQAVKMLELPEGEEETEG